MITAGGIDVGASTVKAAVVQSDLKGDDRLLGAHVERIRRRNPRQVIQAVWEAALEQAGVTADQVEYVASTGDGDLIEFRRGHFYSMTTHARGALFLDPQARAALDVGALHGRVIKMDERGKVEGYRMTSQCASGSGQFLENIARYLGVTLDEIGPLSRRANDPEPCSSICAVLAETDVINMVSRGISIPNILKGIHLSMGGRLLKLVRSAKCDGVVMVTGGLASDEGLFHALAEIAGEQEVAIELRAHPDSVYAGAVGAAIWGAYRKRKLEERGIPVGSA